MKMQGRGSGLMGVNPHSDSGRRGNPTAQEWVQTVLMLKVKNGAEDHATQNQCFSATVSIIHYTCLLPKQN